MKRVAPCLLAACLSTALLAGCERRQDTPTVTPSPEAAAAATADPAPPAAAPPAATSTPNPPVGDPASPPPAHAYAGDTYPAARAACLAEVARKAGVPEPQLTITEVLWAQAGVGVTIQLPGAQAPWSCLSDEQGNVQGAASTAAGSGG